VLRCYVVARHLAPQAPETAILETAAGVSVVPRA